MQSALSNQYHHFVVSVKSKTKVIQNDRSIYYLISKINKK